MESVLCYNLCEQGDLLAHMTDSGFKEVDIFLVLQQSFTVEHRNVNFKICGDLGRIL